MIKSKKRNLEKHVQKCSCLWGGNLLFIFLVLICVVFINDDKFFEHFDPEFGFEEGTKIWKLASATRFLIVIITAPLTIGIILSFIILIVLLYLFIILILGFIILVSVLYPFYIIYLKLDLEKIKNIVKKE